MILASATLAVLLMVATGLVLFRRLARLLLAHEEPVAERELLLLGILPGLALVGLLVTALGLVHLFRWWTLLASAGAVFWFLRRDAAAVVTGLRDGLVAVCAAARQGDLFPLLALLMGIAAAALGIHLSLMPSTIEDVWSYHLPIAHSFITHHGIIPMQMEHVFYGNNPLLFELLFAVPMLAVDHFAAAGIVNVTIYLGLLLLILSFARRARGFHLLLLLAALVWASPFFLRGAAEPMIDVPRSCFSVAAYLFAWRYARDFRRFDLVMSALTAGAGVAGKYTELVTPLLICITLAPLMLRRRQTWMDLVPAALIFAAISSYWYLKNAWLYGNPVYPFLFAHPGLSDAWMADLAQDLGTSVQADQQSLSRNLLTLRGWHDFDVALWMNFRSLIPVALLATLGLALPRRQRWMPWLWSVLLFIFWYVVMFNGRRWAISATLLLFATAFIALFWIVDRVLERRFPARWSMAASGALALVLLLGSAAMATGRRPSLLPRWIGADLASTLGGEAGVARQMAATRPGYRLYRFISGHHITGVLQPLSETGWQEISAYNQGRANVWILPPGLLPATATQTAQFVRRQGVRYFIVSDRMPPRTRASARRDLVLAHAVLERLRSGATLVMRDPSGFSLYRVSPAGVP